MPSAVEGIIEGKTIAPATAVADRLTNSLLDDLCDILLVFWLENFVVGKGRNPSL